MPAVWRGDFAYAVVRGGALRGAAGAGRKSFVGSLRKALGLTFSSAVSAAPAFSSSLCLAERRHHHGHRSRAASWLETLILGPEGLDVGFKDAQMR